MWCAIVDRDWVQAGSHPGPHPPGRSHVLNWGYPGWGDNPHRDKITYNTTALFKVAPGASGTEGDDEEN